jgi:hypothetical protein
METEELQPQRLTSPTTKVRRLGYFIVFCKTIEKELLFSLFSQKVFTQKEELHLKLDEYCRSLPVRRHGNYVITGEITKKDSLDRYYSTALEMGLLEKIGNTILLSKRGQIFVALPAKNNPFDLTIPQIHFFLRTILRKDYDYQRSLLNIILSGKHYQREDRIFRQKVKSIWLNKENKAASLDRMQELNILRKSLSDISRWENPERYYHENIRATRLEWLLDLKLLEYWNIPMNRITIEPKIDVFFHNTEAQYTNNFYECFKKHFKVPVVHWQTLSQNQKEVLIESLLDESMSLFGSEDRLGKISANQFFEYSTSKLVGEGILISTLDLERNLIDFLATRRAAYRYVKIISDVDAGYISRT